MNSEDLLELIWAKKTAIQQMQSTGELETTFVCPLCSQTARMVYTDEEGYQAHCLQGCFGK